MLENEWMKDAEATKILSCLKIPFLTIFKQGKDKHKHVSDLENCLSSVKITDFRRYEFHSLKVSHKLLIVWHGFFFCFSRYLKLSDNHLVRKNKKVQERNQVCSL